MTDTIVYLAGSPVDGIPGTDFHLATELAKHVNVLWVDPCAPAHAAAQLRGWELEPLDGHRVAVLRAPTLRGGSRPLLRSLSHTILNRTVRHVSGDRPGRTLAVVLARATSYFPSIEGAVRVYSVTDDWSAGASLMGLRVQDIQHFERTNVRRANLVTAVSPCLADRLLERHGKPVEVLPNGCRPLSGQSPLPAYIDLPGRVAGVVGQLNERLDFDVLEAVAFRGVSLAFVGPHRFRDRAAAERFEALISRPNVSWLGMQPASSVPRYLAAMSIGLTPYASSVFNRASFPLKTLEYLAAGLPCVSTDTDSVRWLATDLIDRASGPSSFADLVVRRLATRSSEEARQARIAFAREHSWAKRAESLLERIGTLAGTSHLVTRAGGR